MGAGLASLTVLVLVAAAATALYGALYGSRRMFDQRLSDIGVSMRVAYGNPGDLDSTSPIFARTLFRWVARRMPEPDPRSREGKKLAHKLMQAGIARSDAAQLFQIARLTMTMGGALLGLLLGAYVGAARIMPMVLMVIGAGVGAFVPHYYLNHLASGRHQAISSQLSDILDLLVVCVEAGLGLTEAIKIVGSEADRQKQEIGKELAIVSAEMSAGTTLGDALREFGMRTGVEDIKPLAATLVQSEQLGAQIGPSLRSMSDSIRTSRRLRAEEAAQKTTVKILFPLVLFVLPAMMSVIVGPAMIQVMQTLSK